MTKERFIELMQDENSEWSGDNALQGLLILAKYIDPKEHDLIQGANHDIIYGPGIDELIQAGITEEDVITIRKLNWMVDDDTYLACFV